MLWYFNCKNSENWNENKYKQTRNLDKNEAEAIKLFYLIPIRNLDEFKGYDLVQACVFTIILKEHLQTHQQLSNIQRHTNLERKYLKKKLNIITFIGQLKLLPIEPPYSIFE